MPNFTAAFCDVQYSSSSYSNKFGHFTRDFIFLRYFLYQGKTFFFHFVIHTSLTLVTTMFI